MDTSPTPKERYDAEKRAREASRQGEVRKDSGRKTGRALLWWLVALIVLAALVYWLFGVVRTNTPQGEDHSRAIPIQGSAHIPIDSAHDPYNSNPPTSGPHYERPAAVGFYERAFPDERIVHNLEHSDVWVSYRANVATSTREALRQFARNPKVIVTLRAENEWDIALAAWGRLDGFNIAGETISAAERERIKDFILRYQNKGPEQVIDSGAHLEN